MEKLFIHNYWKYRWNVKRTRGEFDQPEGMRFVRKPFAILAKSDVPVVGVTLDQRSLCTLRANAEFIAENRPPILRRLAGIPRKIVLAGKELTEKVASC